MSVLRVPVQTCGGTPSSVTLQAPPLGGADDLLAQSPQELEARTQRQHDNTVAAEDAERRLREFYVQPCSCASGTCTYSFAVYARVAQVIRRDGKGCLRSS